MSFFGRVGGAIKGVGHALAKPAGIMARVGGAAGGFMLGGPGGAMAGYRLGDKIGNVEEDALAGRNVGKNLKSNIIGGAEGAAGMAGAHMMGGGDTSGGDGGWMSKIGGVMKNAGGQLADNFKKPDGSIDFSKLIAAGSAGAGLYGQAKQRKSATKYTNAQIDQRNQLMSKILAPQNYNLPQITPAESPGGY